MSWIDRLLGRNGSQLVVDDSSIRGETTIEDLELEEVSRLSSQDPIPLVRLQEIYESRSTRHEVRIAAGVSLGYSVEEIDKMQSRIFQRKIAAISSPYNGR